MMPHLTDMEELLGAIPSTETRDYMREAMSCYMAGAYRGCIVLAYIPRMREGGRVHHELRTYLVPSCPNHHSRLGDTAMGKYNTSSCCQSLFKVKY